VPEAGPGDVDAAVRADAAALDGPWGRATGFERARAMHRFADILERDARELAILESTDNGKLIRETEGQAKALAGWLRYFAGISDKLEGEMIPAQNPDFLTYTRHEPGRPGRPAASGLAARTARSAHDSLGAST
jgi:aldehyde dehydrogenase (NAD+)